MQLNITTDYAVRTLVCLAKRRGLTNSGEIAEETKVSMGYMAKLLNRLRRGGYVVSYTGVKGGFALAKKPDDINLLEVIRLMEPTIKINRCLEEDSCCSLGRDGCCEIYKCCQIIQDEIEHFFGGITIADLVKGISDNEGFVREAGTGRDARAVRADLNKGIGGVY